MTRRSFLHDTAAAAVGLSTTAIVAAQEVEERRPLVVKASADRAVDSLIGHPRLLRELFEEALAVLAGTDGQTAGDAWRKVLSDDDVIGIKFNTSGAHAFQTTEPMARVLVDSLTGAGWAPERIVLIEVPSQLARDLKTTPARIGWAEAITDFGSGQDQFATVLDQITALINVPFLKTHNIAGVTGCMKNLSHALVRHPARYHDNGCVPYIADIVAVPAIRNKLKLNVMNALRSIWDGGPVVQTPYVFEPGTLLLSRDAVSTDALGLEMLDLARAENRQSPIGGKRGLLPLWRSAVLRRLGVADRYLIQRRHVSL